MADPDFGTTGEPTNSGTDTDPSPRVRLQTSMGDIVVELDRAKAPISVANFLTYVDSGFYDDTIFHRVIADFVVQGGGFVSGPREKENKRATIKNEASNGLRNVRGSLAMARTNDPDSARSQFYINLVDNDSLDYRADFPGYAVFGRVVSGMDVVDEIGMVETSAQRGYNDVPVDEVNLIRAQRE
ncbi:MAG: peptidylprolyl isomerase [Phycisphaerales bacterium]|nr:peptidylprolyl isomerase [Phycisphaerales bacterium]